MERLYDKLKAYSESDFYAFHMPGHKRNKALLGIELPYDLDITEIDGFDDLHHADGILKEEQERAARVFGAEESHVRTGEIRFWWHAIVTNPFTMQSI